MAKLCIPTCAFHMHGVLDSSEFILQCSTLPDVLRAVGTTECGDVPSVADTAYVDSHTNSGSAPCITRASALCVGAALSLTASSADYSPLTRCHTVEGLSAEQVDHFWPLRVAYVAERILHGGAAPRRGLFVTGVFVSRNTAADFTVALITRGTRRDSRMQPALDEFAGAMPLTRVHAELPLCAARRNASLRLWWEPRTERVTPHRTIPPIRVIIEQQQQQQQRGKQQMARLEKQCEAAPQEKSMRTLGGYGAANVFLCRPVASQLRGTTRKSLSVAHSRRRQQQQHAVFLPFDDLSVAEEGEHLVGVEVEPLESYRSFVPPLYGHLAPFLVVAREDA